MRSRRRLTLVAVAMTLPAVALFVSIQVFLLATQPIAHGSSTSSLSVRSECPGFEPDGIASRCTNITFAPNEPVGVGFSVRNTGRFPLTIESIASFGAESEIMLAKLDPALPAGDELFSPSDWTSFEPVSLSPGEEATLQLMGKMRDCDSVRGHWIAGSGIVVDYVRLKVRWLLATTEIDVPLRHVLRIESPGSGECV